MKFYLDEDISTQVAKVMRRLGCQATSTQEAGNRGADDEAQLACAARTGAVLVTRNRNDFIALTTQFFDEGRAHFGVIIVPHSIPPDDPVVLAKLLTELSSNYPRGVPYYAVIFLKSGSR